MTFRRRHLGPNLSIEQDIMMRPYDRRPFLARVVIARSDDQTLPWDFWILDRDAAPLVLMPPA
jgi:hypothetical protein